MKIGFYPGSFDPFTNGHLHVVNEASKLFDKVYIGIGINKNKKRRYPAKEMKVAIEKSLKDLNLDNVEVALIEGLSVDSAKFCNATYFIRGIRNGMDYEYEENLAKINQEISGINTLYLRAGDYGFVSSSFVKELIDNKKEIDKYVPKKIKEYMEEKL